jgi:Spy/CpxP family protein refolding chaperone
VKRLLLILVAFITASVPALAQQPPPGPGDFHPGHGGRGPGAMREHLAEFGLFPPDFVLMNQAALKLTDDQILAITKDVGATHEKVKAAQDSLRPLAEQLHGLLDKPKVDEAAAVALASQIHDQEKQIKMTHLGLMIRVKNVLSPEQQQKLRDLKPARSDRPGGPNPEGGFPAQDDDGD